MSEHAPQPPDPTWERFSDGLKSARAELAAPPSPNQVAALLQRAEDEAERRAFPLRWVLAGAAAVIAVGVVSFAVTREPAEQPWVATAVVASNAQTTGTLTETSSDGRALFVVGDDRVGIGPSSRVELAKASSRATRLVLSKGSVAASVDPSRGKRNFDVETPLGRVHVVGTVFRVATSDEVLVVEVQRGTVEVQYGQATVRVTAGERFTMKGGEQGVVEPRGGEAFDELNEQVPIAVVAPEPEPVVDEPTPIVEDEPVKVEPRKKTPVPASKLAEWRSRAARGECGLVMTEVKKFLAATPDDVMARLTLADCQRRTGDKGGAVDSYLKASSGKGAEANRATLLAASVLQDDLAQPEKALKQLERYLSRGPESRDLEASALVRKARALQAMGKRDQATAVLDGVLKKFGDTSAAPEALRLRDAR